MKDLTRAEEQIMQVLWKLEKAFVKDLIDQLPKPKPAYNTVSTIIRILENKGVVSYKAFGKTHQYFPLLSKEAYMRYKMKDMVGSYFGGSFKALISFFAEDKKLDIKEMDQIMKLLDKLENKK